MSTQLRLINGTTRGTRLDARTRRSGRNGIAEARRRLAAIQPVESKKLPVAS